MYTAYRKLKLYDSLLCTRACRADSVRVPPLAESRQSPMCSCDIMYYRIYLYCCSKEQNALQNTAAAMQNCVDAVFRIIRASGSTVKISL